jgi:hypothetical protein
MSSKISYRQSQAIGCPAGITNTNFYPYTFKVFPNPFSTQTTIQTDNLLHNETLTVYNCFGQKVREITNISGNTSTLYRDNLPNGFYFIQLTQDNKQIETKKLIITD